MLRKVAANRGTPPEKPEGASMVEGQLIIQKNINRGV